jgi:hypothetical protein
MIVRTPVLALDSTMPQPAEPVLGEILTDRLEFCFSFKLPPKDGIRNKRPRDLLPKTLSTQAKICSLYFVQYAVKLQ